MSERKIVKVEEFKKDATERFGEDGKKWMYKCPSCGTEQCYEDFRKIEGFTEDEIKGYIGFSCIGRFDNNKGCNWTLGGLLQIHTLEIETPDGERHKHFELADSVTSVAKEISEDSC